MGCGPSRPAVRQSPIDRKLSEALKAHRDKKDKKHHTLNELLLQFPKLKTGALDGDAIISLIERVAGLRAARSCGSPGCGPALANVPPTLRPPPAQASSAAARSSCSLTRTRMAWSTAASSWSTAASLVCCPRTNSSGISSTRQTWCAAVAGLPWLPWLPAAAAAGCRPGPAHPHPPPGPPAHPHPHLRPPVPPAPQDGSRRIDRMELVLVFIIIHLLHPEKSAQMDPTIRSALQIVEHSFSCFDVSHDGTLQQGEIYSSMMDAQQPAGSTQQASANLFAQLDWDGNGSISIREFLFGLERMVMEEDEAP
jgi:hypothetical protein